MVKEKSAAKVTFLQDLFQFGVYKPSQGKLVRQVTFAAIAVSILLGCYQLYNYLNVTNAGLKYFVPGVLAFAGLWFAYRLVNWVKFADFLISVEAELAKVSWPSRDEVIRSTIVVIVVIFALAAMLFAFDLIWKFIFDDVLNIIKTG